MTRDLRSTSRKLDELRAKLDQLRRGGGNAAPTPRSKDVLFTAEDLRRKLEKERTQRSGTKSDTAEPGPPEGGTTSPGAGPAAMPGKAAMAPIVYGRHLPRRGTPKPPAPPVTGPQVVLETALAGREIVHPRHGKAFLIATDLDSEEQVPEISRELRERFADKSSALLQRVAAQAGTAEFAPHDVVFLDLETTGLSSSPLFLVGAMVWERNGLEVRQFLARNYAEEAAAIGCFLDDCARRRFLVTFNGKSFDLPYLRMRAAANGIPFDMQPFHFDLLHECRRIWKGALPNCSLQTLERHVCGRGRSRDIPGMDIPDAYHAFVRTGNAWQMIDILRHNLLDLVTLADLMTRLPALPGADSPTAEG